MDFIPKDEYIGTMICRTMIQRQAIWCQCALIVHATLTLTCYASIQKMSMDMDIASAVILTMATVIHFCSAEHVETGPITPVAWLNMEKKLERFILAIVFICVLPIGAHLYLAVLVLFFTIVMYYIPHKAIYPLVSLTVIYYAPMVMIPVAIIWTLAKNQYEKWFKETNGTPFSANEIKMAYAWKSAFILMEAFLLWYVRCIHRFPGTIRWHPLIVACVSSMIGCMYCTYYRLPTTVSADAIIVSSSHQMAASLTAATKCCHCKQYIESLDMESTFGDGFRYNHAC